MEFPTIDSTDYSSRGIALWMFGRRMTFEAWFGTQYKLISLCVREGQHDKADYLMKRAEEISDHLRTMGERGIYLLR
jgi:pentatricopeptide repeat protein